VTRVSGQPVVRVPPTKKKPRRRGSGGIFPIREGVWRVDVEVARDPITGRRRRASRTVVGTRDDAEVALARLKVADHERRLPAGGTKARSVRAAFQLYQQAVDVGLIELAPRTGSRFAPRLTPWPRRRSRMGGRLATSAFLGWPGKTSKGCTERCDRAATVRHGSGGARRCSTGHWSWLVSVGCLIPIRPRMPLGRG
jgi:hypothetical protein